MVFIQLAAILGVSLLVIWVLRWLQQPPVVGQMVAGILLGPSLFGLLAPTAQAWLFPPGSLGIIKTLGQMGLVLYMFAVGLQIDRAFFRTHLKGAVWVSVAGVVVPLTVTALLGSQLVGDRRLFPADVNRTTEVLFFAAAMSVTALPVMARIIDERGLRGTVGATVALTAGSVSDIAAWCVLAVVLASRAGTVVSAGVTLGGAIVFIAVVVFGLRPLLNRLVGNLPEVAGGGLPVAFMLIVLLASAATSDVIGIHPVFGAFLVGLVSPRRGIFLRFPDWMAPVVGNLLLPAYFVSSGLNTKVGLIRGLDLMGLLVTLVVTGCLSKGLASFLAARAAGHQKREAAAIGTLMNAHGLIELILLNIALDRGIITSTLFSIMVMMAIITTGMASPLLLLFYPAPDDVGRAGDGVADPAQTGA